MANQVLVKGGDEEPTMTIEQSIKSFYLNPKLSDVCFLVGDERERVYAHRFLLAAESEVFESMFYGELKETKYEIEVPDLTPVGFRNMIKYFYTKKVDEIDLAEMYATYMAANKYLALSLTKDLTGHITKNCLDVSNSCVIYDQLLKLAIDESLISDVKKKIATRSSTALASNSFQQIDENTLFSILKFDRLNVSELELLKACMRWTDSEVARLNSAADPASKRTVFERIKHLIRFGDLSLGDLSSISELGDYLAVGEIGAIFMHLSHPSQSMQIDYRSPRAAPKTYLIRAIQSTYYTGSQSFLVEVCVRVDKAVHVFSIQTFALSNCDNLEFKVLSEGKPLSLDAKIVSVPAGVTKIFTINSALILEPHVRYKMNFSFSAFNRHWLGATNETTFKSESGVTFKVEASSHCIESIAFFGPLE